MNEQATVKADLLTSLLYQESSVEAGWKTFERVGDIVHVWTQLDLLFARFPSERSTALTTLDAHTLCGCVRLYFAVKFRSA